MTRRDPWLIPLLVAALLIVLLLMPGCQQMPGDNALPTCTSHCTVIVIGTQERGGQSGRAEVPLL